MAEYMLIFVGAKFVPKTKIFEATQNLPRWLSLMGQINVTKYQVSTDSIMILFTGFSKQ